MKFTQPATDSLIDALRVVGRPADRIDGPLKVSGLAPYAYERHDVAGDQAYGYALGAAIACGRIRSMDVAEARSAPGVIAVVRTLDMDPLPLDDNNTASLFGGDTVQHYHQAIAVVVAETFEQARAGAALIRVRYDRTKGRFDLDEQPDAPLETGDSEEGSEAPGIDRVGDVERALADAPVTIDRRYSTPDQTHAMMEPHASIAAWEGDRLTLWTSNQMIAWGRKSLATLLRMPRDKVRVDSPYVGGGFGGKLFVRADAVLAALGARAAGRPVKLALQRPLIANNTTHRPATRQRIRLGATRDGRVTAIAHESLSGDMEGGKPETAVAQTKMLYASPTRQTSMRLATLDLPEGNAMRAPGEAPGMMALEIAMDEMAEALGMDPVEFRILNDTQVDPEAPERSFSDRNLVRCLREGAERFGWSRRQATPGGTRDGRWLVGMGVASGFRDSPTMKSGARVRLEQDARITVETDMTDIGTGSYTILAQVAAEVMGVPLEQVTVRLGDSDFPVAAGSGGQWGANSSASGVYAACAALRQEIARKMGINEADVRFEDGQVGTSGRMVPLAAAVRDKPIVAEDRIEFGDLADRYQMSTFAGHFVEVGVDAYTGETRIRRMLAVCDAGRILNPKSARSQVIGAMTMGAGAALMEALEVDKRFGFFVNHDLATYEVPVHADIPHQEVHFLDTLDPYSSPLKAKGVGELGLCGVGAAIANAIYDATGVRVRDYPITVDKLIGEMPAVA